MCASTYIALMPISLVRPGCNELLHICLYAQVSNRLGLTYLEGPRFILTHRSSKHASEVLTAMTATIPTTIAVMSTVPSFSMVPMDAVSIGVAQGKAERQPLHQQFGWSKNKN